MTGDSRQTEVEHLTPQQIDTRHAHKLLERALTQVERGEHETAMLSCRQAIGLAPNSFPAHSFLSMLCRRNDNLDEAITHSAKALAILPENELERERLTALRASHKGGLTAPRWRVGEWEQFRQEILREIKLSALLESQNLANVSPTALHSTALQNLGDDAFSGKTPTDSEASSLRDISSNSSTGISNHSRNSQRSRLAFSVAAAIVFGVLIVFFSTRGAKIPQSSQTSNNATTINNGNDGSLTNRQAGNAQTPVNPALSDTPAAQPNTTAPNISAPASIPAGSAPSSANSPTSMPTRPTGAGSTPGPSAPASQSPPPLQTPSFIPRPLANERPAATPPRQPLRTPRPADTVSQYPQPSPAPIVDEPPPVKPKDDNVGPRFSPSGQDDNVGPRFSTPQ